MNFTLYLTDKGRELLRMIHDQRRTKDAWLSAPQVVELRDPGTLTWFSQDWKITGLVCCTKCFDLSLEQLMTKGQALP
jgi:hypothetical protein